MKILLIGSGAREHALAWKLLKSPLLSELFIWPGNVASRRLGTPLDFPHDGDFGKLATVAKNAGIEAVICGPEQPLEAGLADTLWSHGLPVFGPCKSAAELESSKFFAKSVMASAGIRTAHFSIAKSPESCREQAIERLNQTGGVVLKASGLASGKGVFVCSSRDQIEEALERLYGPAMRKAAEVVVVEDVLRGRECSYFAFLGRGKSTGLGFAVDYKRLLAGDLGPNTGGMGSYTPVPWLPANAAQRVESEIVEPLLKELARRNIEYCGWLYVGIMWNESGPEVVEFNVRLGDPEAQILAVADDRDWLALALDKMGVKKMAPGTFPPFAESRKVVGFVMASAGYPFGGKAEASASINRSVFTPGSDVYTFAASVKEGQEPGSILAGSGRVLTVIAAGDSFAKAREKALAQVMTLATDWPECQWREDIALSVINEEK